MAENRVFVGREAELKQFKEVLHDTNGQAIIVVGQAGMGKSSLIEKMCEEAVSERDLKCAWVRYEVTGTDEPDTTMGLMMDNAFDAACAEERSLDMTDRRKKQWSALIKLIVPRGDALTELVDSLRYDVQKNKREQFVERLRLVSKRMPDEGRVIFVIDSDKYMKKGSADAWRLVVEQLPDKVKFVFGQRPEDELTKNRRFGALENVVRIPKKRLRELADGEVKDLVRQRADEVGQRREVLDGATKRYKGHPYMLQAGLDLVKERRTVEGLPDDPTPENIAEDQWEQVKQQGQEAIRLFKAYAILDVRVPGDMVDAVGEVSSDVRDSLSADDFLGGLLREESGGRRIYHAILSDHVLSKMNKEEKKQYHRRAAAAYRDKPVVVNPTRREEIEPLLKAVEHLLAAGEPVGALVIFFMKPSEESYYSPGEWLWMFGYLDEYIRIIGDAIRVYEEVIGKGGGDEQRSVLGKCYVARGLALADQGKLDEAIADYGRAIGTYEELVETEGQRELRNDLAMCYNNRGNVLQDKGRLDEAIEDYGRAIGIREELVEKEGRRELRNGLATCYNNRGIALKDQGKLNGAIVDYGRAIDICKELVEEEGRRELRNDLAMCYNNRGNALADKGKLDKAIEDLGRGIEIYEELVEKEGRRELRGDLASCYNNRGLGLGAQGKLDESIRDLGRAIGVMEELVEKEGRREMREDLESSLFNRALARTQKKYWKGARGDIEKGAGILRELIEEGQRHVISSFMRMAGYRCSYAEELGGVKEAAEWANDAMRWFVEEAEAGRMNEVLSKEGREFADDVFGKREELIKGGLDEEVLGRFVEVMKEIYPPGAGKR